MFTLTCDRDEVLHANLLWDLGENKGLTPEKIRDLWAQASKYPVLFSDYTNGKFEPFYWTLVNPVSVWFEVSKEGEETPIGLLYSHNIHPTLDATAHISFWDRRAKGREPLILFVTEWLMDRFSLMRINATIPPYQRGVIRFMKRLGFVEEGEMRDAALYNGRPWGMKMFGLTRSDLERSMQELY